MFAHSANHSGEYLRDFSATPNPQFGHHRLKSQNLNPGFKAPTYFGGMDHRDKFFC